MSCEIPESARYPVFRGDGRIDFVEKPVPRPGPGQLLIRPRANAICASETPAYRDGSAVAPGHEAAGTVVAAGPGTRTAEGTPGVVYLMDFCGDCPNCRTGATNQCLAKRADYGFTRDGGYAPYELVNENVFFAVDDDISPAEATLLLDVMGTGGHSIERGRLVRPDGESLLVMGAGPIGLGVVAMAKLIWGEDFPVIVTDLLPFRLELAEKLGGRAVNIREEPLADGLARCGLEHVDIAIDASGKAPARRAAMGVLAKRGVLVCVGHGGELKLEVSPDLIAPERAVLGSEYFRYDELPHNLELLRAHRDYLGQIITHRFGIDEIAGAFETFAQGATGKVVVEQ